MLGAVPGFSGNEGQNKVDEAMSKMNDANLKLQQAVGKEQEAASDEYEKAKEEKEKARMDAEAAVKEAKKSVKSVNPPVKRKILQQKIDSVDEAVDQARTKQMEFNGLLGNWFAGKEGVPSGLGGLQANSSASGAASGKDCK